MKGSGRFKGVTQGAKKARAEPRKGGLANPSCANPLVESREYQNALQMAIAKTWKYFRVFRQTKA